MSMEIGFPQKMRCKIGAVTLYRKEKKRKGSAGHSLKFISGVKSVSQEFLSFSPGNLKCKGRKVGSRDSGYFRVKFSVSIYSPGR